MSARLISERLLVRAARERGTNTLEGEGLRFDERRDSDVALSAGMATPVRPAATVTTRDVQL